MGELSDDLFYDLSYPNYHSSVLLKSFYLIIIWVISLSSSHLRRFPTCAKC